jgi:predicted Rossmann fold nucleotide-binding protein DprA/Smf involved in DNA uptake
MEKFFVIIAGSRDFNDYELLKTKCNQYLEEKRKTYEIVIVSGHARGADKFGEQYAAEEGFQLEIYKADWDKYGKRAGYRRNEQMAEVGDAVIAFWDGESKGTKHMIDIMKEENKLVRVVKYNEATCEKK